MHQALSRKLLERSGYQVTLSCDGLEAVQTWRANPKAFNAILMDIQMPNMDGLEATRWIRSLESPTLRPIPIIAYSARSGESDHELCLSAGMNDYVPKASEPQVLYEAIRRLLSHEVAIQIP